MSISSPHADIYTPPLFSGILNYNEQNEIFKCISSQCKEFSQALVFIAFGTWVSFLIILETQRQTCEQVFLSGLISSSLEVKPCFYPVLICLYVLCFFIYTCQRSSSI